MTVLTVTMLTVTLLTMSPTHCPPSRQPGRPSQLRLATIDARRNEIPPPHGLDITDDAIVRYPPSPSPSPSPSPPPSPPPRATTP